MGLSAEQAAAAIRATIARVLGIPPLFVSEEICEREVEREMHRGPRLTVDGVRIQSTD
jgi:hypothetical protein